MDERLVPIVCPYCGVGCGLYISTQDGRVTGLEYMREHPVNEGALCAKGNVALDLVYHRDRLLFPLKRDADRLHRISWAEGLDAVSQALSVIRDKYSPDALGFLASAKATNEENYLFQKLARMLGTNNIDHQARLHHETVDGLAASFGSSAMTNPVTDLAKADCIFIIGSNFAEKQPILSRWVLDAKERGAKIIVADPRYTPTAWSADLYLPLLSGTDVPLIYAMMYVILKEGLWNREFVESRSEGFEELRAAIETCPPLGAQEITSVKAEDIETAARMYANAKASSIVCNMGVDTAALENLANLAMLCGHIGRAGTGVNPLRGQDNVQGACDMGALPNFFPAYQPVTDQAVREKFAAAWQMDASQLSPRIGLALPEMIQSIDEGRLRGMVILGENPVVSDLNSAQVEAAFKKLDFLAIIELFPSETTQLAHVILPAASFAEKRGTKTATDRRVQWFERAIAPVGETMPDWKIVCEIARRLGLKNEFDYEDEESILIEIRSLAPIYAGITPRRLQAKLGGVHWPCWSEENGGMPILYSEGFKRPDSKGRMIAMEYSPPVEPVIETMKGGGHA